MFVLSNAFLSYAFKFKINRPVAAVLSTWSEIRTRMIVTISRLLLSSSCVHTILWLQAPKRKLKGYASRMKCYVVMPGLFSDYT